MAFKRVATLDIQRVYANDKSGKFEWRSFVKQANEESLNKKDFLPKIAYEFDKENFLYLTARMISGWEKHGHNGNYDAFPWEDIKKSKDTAIGKGFYIEHKEDSEEDAKGIILDTFPNDKEEFLVALCAIDKNEYPDFCQQILDGIYNQVSMSCLSSSCECLTPGTHILTPEGQTKIQDIKAGDYVLTHKGRFRKVLETFKNPMPEYTYKIYYESGRNNQVVNDNNRYNGVWIRATGNHPIYMANGSWKKAEDIKEGDYVKCLTKKCVVCGKDIVFSKKQKYCSASCQSKDILNRPGVKEKQVATYKKTVQNRTEKDKKILHEVLSNGQKKFQQSANYKQRKKEMSIKQNETFKKHIEDGTLDNERKRRKEWMSNIWKNPEYREKFIEIARENMKKLAHKKRSFLEEKFEGFLIREGLKKDIDYKTNDFLYVDKLRTYPDFKFESQKLIVEIDGEYWHNNPEAIKKDSYKNKIWEENGWTVIRYTGKQVNNEFEKVKDSFRRIFKNHNHEYTFGDFKVIKVEKIKTTPKCHNVYNLHVDEDESYIAENLVVHNCSKCHNVATSFDNLCEHMNPNNPITYMKGKKDNNGEDIYEINRDLVFTGLSAVAVPADKDAFVFDIKASKNKNTIDNEFRKYQMIKKANILKELEIDVKDKYNKKSSEEIIDDLIKIISIITHSFPTNLKDTESISALSNCDIAKIALEILKEKIEENIQVQELENCGGNYLCKTSNETTEGEIKKDIKKDVYNFAMYDKKEIDSCLEEYTENKQFSIKSNKDTLDLIAQFNSFTDSLEFTNIQRVDSRGQYYFLNKSNEKKSYIWLELDKRFGNGSIGYKIDEKNNDTQFKNILPDTFLNEIKTIINANMSNAEKEIDSYLDGDNYSYTPFSSTSKFHKNKEIKANKYTKCKRITSVENDSWDIKEDEIRDKLDYYVEYVGEEKALDDIVRSFIR